MSEQEVFNKLSELEEYFYYRLQNPKGLPFDALARLHDEINAAMLKWHELTGCKNE